MIGKLTLLTCIGIPGAALLTLPPSGVGASASECYQDGKEAEAIYAGSKVCRKCHEDQYKTWKKTKMASSFDLLKPGERAEQKTEAGLDPDQDYTRDEKCLPCHTTGWGEPGGYAIPPEGDTPESRKAQKLAASMQGVQCEACHGPGKKAVAYKREQEAYQWSEAKDKGLTAGMEYPTKERCVTCHNTESPFAADDHVFDFDSRRDEGTHTHYPMDFDHGCPHEHHVTKKKKKKKKK